MNNAGLYFIIIFVIYLLWLSVRNILIGIEKIKHPMYETEQKRKYILRNGIITLSLTTIFGGILLAISLIILL